ncbi:hypothetical protein BO94DRAFT_126168 [Aspergillus sclerotioniger CBS 115572]|uniref:Uncharacterized protein n=1 Tax=Aspergillus sclerotioniger CBS 115572 TaxID=1450535 RepID=A0A317XES1_9EURO|nr:hypothetical protein BO94DRAFT_126168 [Aspergillus sclerotioniger CBS 115572]PWY95468.1 hypothetical protein BO94DRAFT_126168 [Aspergillus sclerotioniger CBS 115572]
MNYYLCMIFTSLAYLQAGSRRISAKNHITMDKVVHCRSSCNKCPISARMESGGEEYVLKRPITPYQQNPSTPRSMSLSK